MKNHIRETSQVRFISRTCLAYGYACRFFNIRNIQRTKFQQRIHALLAKAEIEQCIQNSRIRCRNIQVMIETTSLHPALTEQGIQVLYDRRVFIFSKCITGQINISASSPRMGSILTEQVCDHLSIAECGKPGFELLLPEYLYSFLCHLRVFKTLGQ